MPEQNFSNHTKFFPLFHFFTMPVFLLNFAWSVYMWKHAGFPVRGLVWVLTSAALITGMLASRTSALKVQDRVIRLEEQLRYARLLPADLQPRIGEFTLPQLVSLRFASDAELPALARKVLDGKMQDRKAIKQMVQNWRADHLRA